MRKNSTDEPQMQQQPDVVGVRGQSDSETETQSGQSSFSLQVSILMCSLTILI